MHEESQLNDMRSAIRGDFERLAERRGEQELMRMSSAPKMQDAESPVAVEPVVEPRRAWFSRLIST